ncbi:uncharacterized protein PV07_04267 [Cladophialophora immunda]|uniref:Uncharacterized protein n=1 Tax=Cladophialophora immunda TaxID=569365 RepID=A0A0D2CRZ1_9EURO|nr:uncharacterized protein PV07_04267 [Cladophialophora immunda]KIW32740.1 hypothetical protein PV07_04267 [Cladophialophora immunda]
MQPPKRSDQELDFELDFLSLEEHRTIRTLTQILYWTQPLAESDDEFIEFLGQVCSEPDQAQQDSQHKLLNNFLRSIDGEGSEAIAVLPGRFKASGLALFAAGSQRPLNDLVSVDNRQEGEGGLKPANAPQNGSKGTIASKEERCRVGFTRYEVPPGFVHDPLPSFFDLLQERGGEVPPALTLQLTLVLLKHGQAQIGKEARRKSYEDFSLFITCVGLSRLWERFDFGATSRNFYQIIRLLDEDEPTPASLTDAVRDLKSPRAHEERFSDVARFTEPMKSDFKVLLKKLRLVSGFDYRQSGKIEYDTPRVFYRALSSLLKRLRDTLNCAKLYQPKGGQSTFDRAAFGDAICALEGTVHLLWRFVDRFREEIHLTLKWVAGECKLRDGACQSSKDRVGMAGTYLEGEHVIPLEEIKMKWNWPGACLQWLELLVAQQAATRDIHVWAPFRTRKSKSLRQLVPQAKIHTIQFRSAPWDRGSHDMSNVRQELEQEKWLFKTHGIALIAWLEHNGHTDLDAAEFKGSVHCETTLLTLQALTLPGAFRGWNWGVPSPEKTSQCLRSRNITVPPQVITSLRASREVLGLSRRCCQGCRAVFYAIRDLQNFRRRLPPPSFHGVWLPMALPPWTPRNIGLKLLDQLELEIQHRGRLAFDLLPLEERKELSRLFDPDYCPEDHDPDDEQDHYHESLSPLYDSSDPDLESPPEGL